MLNNISIRSKMALLVTVPIFAIVFALFVDSYKNYNSLRVLSSIEQMLLFAQKSSHLVHYLQKERGASAGYINSGGGGL